MSEDEIIVQVKFNGKPPTAFNYKHFTVELEGGEIKVFHYNINNPIPTREEIIGLTWEELCDLCKKKFYEVINFRGNSSNKIGRNV